jgi:hypothetical protein
VKHLIKVKVRRAYIRRKLGERYKAELRRPLKKLLAAQGTFLNSLLQNESKS